MFKVGVDLALRLLGTNFYVRTFLIFDGMLTGLPIDEFSRKKMDATAQELSEEKALAYSCLE